MGTLLLAAGVGIQAFGQLQAGKAAAEQGKQEQLILEQNANLKRREGEAEEQRARAKAIRFGKEGEAFQATARVNIAKGGVLAKDTTALVLETNKEELDADRRSILREGFLSKSFRLSEASNLQAQGSAARARGRNIRTASRYRTTGTILSGFGQFSDSGGLNFLSKKKPKVTVKRPVPTSTTGGANRPTVTRRG